MERRDALSIRDVDELESHLRDRVDALTAAGLTDDEAFLIAVKRLGSMDELSREYAAEHSGRLWKQLVLHDSSDTEGADASSGTIPFARRANGLAVALLLGVGAGIAVKATELLTGEPELVFRNIAVLVLPFLAAWFAWRRRPPAVTLLGVAAAFAAVALALNLYPFDGGSSTVEVAMENSATAVLATLGSIVALWLVTGIVDAGGVWRSDRTRMDFLRFSGEWLVYYVLIAIVGGALSGLTVAVFASIQVDVMPFIGEWVLPCGAAGAVLVSAWLVGAKQRVIENIAPVLTKVFTPLFTLMMLALIVASVMQWNLVDGSRDLLIAFDLVLVVVVALLVYSISARDPALRARLVRSTAGAHARGRARRRRHRARRDDRPHGRVRVQREQDRLARAERHPPREPRVGHVAAGRLRAPARAVRRHRALADRLPAGLPRLGGDPRVRLPAGVRLRVTGHPSVA